MKIYAPAFLALATGSIALWGVARAQTPPPAFVPCTRMADPAERLGCYDRQMAAMGAVVATSPPASPGTPPKAPIPAQAVASITAPPPPAAVPPVAAPPATSEARFGAEDIKQTERPKHSKEEKVLLSTITSIRQVRPKLFMIVLANGQIWMQDGTQITAFFRAGYEARIERGLLGDYRMSTAQTGEKNMVRVTRLQ